MTCGSYFPLIFAVEMVKHYQHNFCFQDNGYLNWVSLHPGGFFFLCSLVFLCRNASVWFFKTIGFTVFFSLWYNRNWDKPCLRSLAACLCVCVCWRRQPRDCAYKHFQASRCEKPLALSLCPQEWKREKEKRREGRGASAASPFVRLALSHARKRTENQKSVKREEQAPLIHTRQLESGLIRVFAKRNGVKLEREHRANPWGWPWPLTFNLWPAGRPVTKKKEHCKKLTNKRLLTVMI